VPVDKDRNQFKREQVFDTVTLKNEHDDLVIKEEKIRLNKLFNLQGKGPKDITKDNVLKTKASNKSFNKKLEKSLNSNMHEISFAHLKE